MNSTVTVLETEIQIKEYRGKRVVTFRDIDTVHQRPEGTARKRFNDNRKHFISGVDFFKISMSEIRTLGIEDDYNYPKGIILITESGYLMMVKSFTDDLAWKVQRELVDSYFRFRKEKREEVETVTASMVKPGDLIRCAEIMAGCLEGNRGYVLNILRNVIPDIDAGAAPVKADSVMMDVPERERPADATEYGGDYAFPFNHNMLSNYLMEHGISRGSLERMVGCSEGLATKWCNGFARPTRNYRVRICEALDLPVGYFDNTKRCRRMREHG